MKKIRGLNVRYVDGFLIRSTLDDDFGVIGRHNTELAYFSPKFYIPQDELWIDAPFHEEIDFLLQGEFFYEDHPVPSEMNYHKVRQMMKKELCLTGPVPNFESTRSKGDSSIVYVDGSIIRRYFDPEFIFGGHGYVYDYIPKNELWLDARMDERELSFIELHERVEWEHMKAGKTYDEAHEFATAADKEQRRRNLGTGYPGDKHFPWRCLSTPEILQKYYVDINY